MYCRRTILVALCIAMCLFFIGCGKSEESAEPTQDETKAHYEAYYSLCMDYQEKYGFGEYSAYDFEPGSGDLMGLSVVRLIDFDRDGTEELLVVYNNGSQGSAESAKYEVWTCKDELVNVLPATGISRGTDVSGWLEIAMADEELFVNINIIKDMNVNDWLYYDGDTFISKYRSEGDIYSSTGSEPAYYIEGEKVSEEKYLEASIPELTYDYDTPLFSENGEMFVRLIYIDEAYADKVLDETAKTLMLLENSSKPSSEASENSEVSDNPDALKNLPEFIFASGSGGWSTRLTVSEDGTFTGKFTDSDMGATGDGYPNGTVTICNFTGKFSDVESVDEYTYSMRLESMELENKQGEEWIEDGIKYIATGPYGLEDATDFLLFLPGAPVDSLPEDYISWVAPVTMLDDDILPFHGLYNEVGKMGFFSQN